MKNTKMYLKNIFVIGFLHVVKNAFKIKLSNKFIILTN